MGKKKVLFENLSHEDQQEKYCFAKLANTLPIYQIDFTKKLYTANANWMPLVGSDTQVRQQTFEEFRDEHINAERVKQQNAETRKTFKANMEPFNARREDIQAKLSILVAEAEKLNAEIQALYPYSAATTTNVKTWSWKVPKRIYINLG